jgi:hypothetical protein
VGKSFEVMGCVIHPDKIKNKRGLRKEGKITGWN